MNDLIAVIRNEFNDVFKGLLRSVLWAFITMGFPLVMAYHLHVMYGLRDSTILFCIGYWWYMVVSGSERVTKWLEAIIPKKGRAPMSEQTSIVYDTRAFCEACGRIYKLPRKWWDAIDDKTCVCGEAVLEVIQQKG